VAADLGIRPLTVRSHLKSIMTKMGAHSTAEAVSTGFRLGIVPPPTGSGGGPTVVDEPQ
jgi:DNA-binding CsgD family transcriptional regulator